MECVGGASRLPHIISGTGAMPQRWLRWVTVRAAAYAWGEGFVPIARGAANKGGNGMRRKASRRASLALTGLAVIAMSAAFLAVPSGASTHQAQQGIDKQNIQIVG